MNTSRKFEKFAKKAIQGAESLKASYRIQEVFEKAVSFLPEKLPSALFQYYYLHDFPNAYTIIENASLVIELMEGEFYDPENKISNEQWQYIRDLLDEFAAELDTKRLEYIMQIIIDKGQL